MLVKLPVNLLASPYTLVAAGTSLEQQRFVRRASNFSKPHTDPASHYDPPYLHCFIISYIHVCVYAYRLHFPFSLLAPCRDPALAHLHSNQLRPAWVLMHSPYTVLRTLRCPPQPPLFFMAQS